MIQRHASRFRASELREDSAHSDILDARGVEVRVPRKGGFKDLDMGLAFAISDETGPVHSCKHLFWVGISKAALVCSCYWGSKSGEENNVIGILLQDILQPFLCVCHVIWRCSFSKLKTAIGELLMASCDNGTTLVEVVDCGEVRSADLRRGMTLSEQFLLRLYNLEHVYMK